MRFDRYDNEALNADLEGVKKRSRDRWAAMDAEDEGTDDTQGGDAPADTPPDQTS